MDNPLQQAYGDVLLDRLRAQHYPSVTEMNLLESIATPQVLVEYTMHLMERIETEPFPSVPMMQRVAGLVGRWGVELPPAGRG